ncbi:LuxR C-terminal-related transcriptional regulator [Nocardia harenae]|uniref:LuxR C-terminal-related transcriptional regulator n=1 Tax=Nocardia harenae TaxID=358707 RepID=UPI000B074738|nr:LuxR C-terminal-related transcriptional regulator [Nocardia harenae]
MNRNATAMPDPEPLRYADPGLSAREAQVVREWLLAENKNQVCRKLYLAPGTVNTHLARARRKYDEVGRPAVTKAQLLARAVQDELLSLDEF